MSRTLACLACGTESHDVSMRLVETDEAGRRIVGVLVPVSNRVGAIEVSQDVPERYVNEPRCRDTAACQERVWAMRPAVPAQPVPAAEPISAHVAEEAAVPEIEAPSWF